MVATNLIGKKTTTPEQMLLQQIEDRNATWATEDASWKAESSKYQKQYDAYISTKPNWDTDFTERLNYHLTTDWIPTFDPKLIKKQHAAANNLATQYANTRQFNFNEGLINMQNARTERVSWYNSQLSARSNELERYLDLRAKDAKDAIARRNGLAAEQQRRASASYIADEEQLADGRKSFLEGM